MTRPQARQASGSVRGAPEQTLRSRARGVGAPPGRFVVSGSILRPRSPNLQCAPGCLARPSRCSPPARPVSLHDHRRRRLAAAKHPIARQLAVKPPRRARAVSDPDATKLHRMLAHEIARDAEHGSGLPDVEQASGRRERGHLPLRAQLGGDQFRQLAQVGRVKSSGLAHCAAFPSCSSFAGHDFQGHASLPAHHSITRLQ